MSVSFQTLANIAVELQSGLSRTDRFQRLVSSLRGLLRCDASALLRYEQRQFRPLAIDGLLPDVLGRRFELEEHPRLEAIARAGDIVRFPADSSLPDPYDGLMPGHDHLKVHACVGLPLFTNHDLIGALTFDCIDPNRFDVFTDEQLRLIGALAAVSLSNALLVERLEKQAVAPAAFIDEVSVSSNEEMIGLSPLIVQLNKEISAVAASDLNVLINGETGVGKELVARAIHRGSPRCANPLIYLNCAALPESVAESELFGHVKGAFTGAIHDRKGKFELADKGTLFLDEIGELSLPLQAKLLRVLQYGDIQRVGDDTMKRVDVRVLAATNKDLKKAITDGQFRIDLYHRLSVFPLFVPPLRERGSDITLLSGYFCERSRVKLGLHQLMLAPEAQQALESYVWPGNVRELEHAIYRAAVIAKASQRQDNIQLLPIHFSFTEPLPQAEQNEAFAADSVVDLASATQRFQRQMIRQTLAKCDNNWAACARLLGMDGGNLHRLAKRLGLKQ
jgi:anaerobic nitric oxide reductase transcription regulator